MAEFGAFGKIPALGDFFRSRVPQGFVEVWDPWLQERLLDLRTALGDGWRDAYLSAPIWRFSLSAGVAGPAPVLGVLMPSVDRVGRDFPLTLVAAVPNSRSPFSLHAASEACFAALENVALAALSDAASFEALTSSLEDVAGVSAETTRIVSKAPGRVVLSTNSGVGPALLGAVTMSWSRPTLWSAYLDGETRVFAAEGLPGADYVRPLFDLDAPIWAPQPATVDLPS